jgi:hypothetical protein
MTSRAAGNITTNEELRHALIERAIDKHRSSHGGPVLM